MVAGLGDSPKPLDRSVIREPERQFMATFREWAADGNVEQIFINRSSSGIIYVVPKNNTFFITNATISIRCTSGAPSSRTAILSVDGDFKTILSAVIVGGNTAETSTQSFSMPIKVDNKLQAGISANLVANFYIQGFLLPKKISIR